MTGALSQTARPRYAIVNMINRLFPVGITIRKHTASATGPRHLETGAWGEEVAAGHLAAKGYKILGRRVKAGLRGELDIVTRSPEGVLVFVEVKARADESFGRPFAAVDRRKQRALSRAAWTHLNKLRPRPDYFRFDVVEVIGSPDRGEPVVRHIENAFSLMGSKRLRW